MIIDHDFYAYRLLDVMNVSFGNDNAFRLLRIDPADTSDQDKISITQMLNKMEGNPTVQTELE
jgi:hypothetical protein